MAEILSGHDGLMKGEGLQVLGEKIKTIDLDENEIYKFLAVEQADSIKTGIVFERIKEVTKIVRMLVNTELNDAYLISAITAQMISVAAYPMNFCKFNNGELNQLDQVIKKELHAKNMLGRQASEETFYLKREEGGRGLKSVRNVYKKIRLRVACYMSKSTSQWIKAAWGREQLKEENAIIAECLTIMEEAGVRIRFEGGNIRLDDDLVEAEWKPTWKKVKSTLKRCRMQAS